MPQELTIRIDLNSPVTLAGVKAITRGFLDWWVSELLECMPRRWQKQYRTLFRTPLLLLGAESWRLTGIGDDAEALSIDPKGPVYESREHLVRAAGTVLVNGVTAQLSPSDVLLRRINLPAAALSRLRSVVRLQLDRLSPFRGDDVFFDCRTLETDEEGEIGIEVAIVSKSILHNYEKKMREIGLVPCVFAVTDSPLKFSPIGLPWTGQRQLQMLLAVCGVLLWGAAIWLAPAVRDSEIASLTAEASSLRPAVLVAETERQELNKYQLPPAAISANRQRDLDVLAILTKLLPLSAHLVEFTMEDGVIQLRGTAPASLRIGALLAKSKMFGRIDYPKTPWSQNIDHFELKTTLRSVRTQGFPQR